MRNDFLSILRSDMIFKLSKMPRTGRGIFNNNNCKPDDTSRKVYEYANEIKILEYDALYK